MISFKITYNGNEYESIESAMNDAVISGIIEIVNDKIKELQAEIDNSGGYLRIDFTGESYNANIVFVDIPNELSEKIKAALS